MGLSKQIKLNTLKLHDEKCYYCGALATTVDHVLPKSRGGTNDPENLVACCKACNQRAGNKVFLSREHKRWYLNTRYKT